MAMFLAATTAFAQPSFELDLSELKKPAPPAPQEKPKPKPRQAQTKVVQKPVQSKQPSQVETKPAVKTTQAQPKPATVKATPLPQPQPTAAPVSKEPTYREVILATAPPCEMVPSILAIVATPVSTSELLNGITLAAPYAASYSGANLIVTCGLPAAEEMTFRKILASRGTELLNIIGHEQPDQLMFDISSALGISYQLQMEQRKDRGMVFVLPPRNSGYLETRLILIPTKKAP